VSDEYNAVHRAALDDPAVEAIRRYMAPKKLVIADGHHREQLWHSARNERNWRDL
jgi:uncharacterized protein (DUF1015 family)